MGLSARIQIRLNIALIDAEALGTRRHEINEQRGVSFTNGTGANKVDCLYDEIRTLADGANETIDLHDGSLNDSLGDAVTMDILRGIYVKNTSTTASLIIGGAAANAVGIFADAGDKFVLPPLGELTLLAPDATGVDVTTNAALKFEHDGTGSADLIYHIVVVGED